MRPVFILTSVMVLVACQTAPPDLSVVAIPGRGKSLEAFRGDQTACKQFAADKIDDSARSSNVTHALEAVGDTLLGSGVGAAFGGGHGAAAGAAIGAASGVAYGLVSSSRGQDGLQRRYDVAYTQCMVMRHNQVPVLTAAGVVR